VTPHHEKQHRLLDLARGQGGYFSAGQATELGFPKNNRHLLVKNGIWEQVRRGIFRLASEPEPPHGDLHWMTLFFRRRDGSPSAVFGLETAAQIHGIGDFMPASIIMLVEPRFQKRAVPPEHVRLEEVPSIKMEVELIDGLPVTTPMRTIVDLLNAKDRDREETRRAFLQARSTGILSPPMVARATWLDEKSRGTLRRWELHASRRRFHNSGERLCGSGCGGTSWD
jgi:predicted transcriptional regulator of viral defense system